MTFNLPRGERLLGFIAAHAASPDCIDDDGDCWHCGGEGVTFVCIDGFCADAEIGCDICTRDCPECALRTANTHRAVRIEVLRHLDVDLAAAWLRQNGRWSDDLTGAEILAHLHERRTTLSEFTADERADSAAWVEGLIGDFMSGARKVYQTNDKPDTTAPLPPYAHGKSRSEHAGSSQ